MSAETGVASPLARPRGRRLVRRSWPVALVLIVAALSWGALTSVQVTTTSTMVDAAHSIAAARPQGPGNDVLPTPRASLIAALRGAAAALVGAFTFLRIVGWSGIVLIAAAITFVGDARRRWRARLVGAPPHLDVHLV